MRRATGLFRVGLVAILISIHALHEESDSGMRELAAHLDISIHALHEESDWRIGKVAVNNKDFNPRSP